MPIIAEIKTVTTSPTLLHAAFNSSMGNLLPVVIRNDSVVDAYLGGATVTTSDGLRFPPGNVLVLDLGPGDAIYAVVATGTTPLQVLGQRR